MATLDELMRTAKIDSDMELARRLKAGLEERGDPLPRAENSLTAEFRKLRQGRHAWFERRPAALDVLCEILDAEPHEIVPTTQHRGETTFDELPALKALPTGEPPVRYGTVCPAPRSRGSAPTFARVQASGRTQLYDPPSEVGLRWIRAPGGAGKTLAVKRLSRRIIRRPVDGQPRESRVRASSVRDLGEASRLCHYDGPLLLEIAAPGDDPAVMHAALRALTDHGDVTVLARFERPEFASASEDSDASWSDWEWLPEASRRAEFLGWLAQRLPRSSLLDARQAANWLHKHDPRATRFPTPRDILLVAAAFHVGGPQNVRNLGSTWSRWRSQDSNHPSERWLRQTRDDLVRCRLNALQHRIEGGLDAQEWAALLDGGGPPRPSAEIDALLEAHREGGEKSLAAGAEIRAALSAADPAGCVAAAQEHGVLGTAQDGRLEIGPPWLLEDSERAVVTTAVRKGLASWARWCVCRERRRIVEGALGKLDDGCLADLVSVVVEQWNLRDAASVAAGGVVAAAVARRLARCGKESPLLSAPLTDLGQLIWKGAGRVFPSYPPVLAFWDLDDLPGWVATCWSLSISSRPPDGWRAEHDAVWLFPGWSAASPNLRQAPEWMRTVAPRAIRQPSGFGAELEDSEHTLIRLARHVAALCDFDGCERTPPILLYARISMEADDPTTILSRADLDSLSHPVVRVQLRALEEHGGDDALAAGLLIWRSLVASSPSVADIPNSLQRLDPSGESALPLVRTALDPPTLRQALSGRGWPEGGLRLRFVEWLPERLRECAVAVAVEHGSDALLRSILERWGPAVELPVGAWEQLLKHPNATWEVARDFHRAQPARATELLETLDHDDPRLELLLHELPREQVDAAVVRLSQCPTPACKHRAPNRLARLIERRPDLAEPLYELLLETRHAVGERPPRNAGG